MIKVLKHFGFEQISQGKTNGSRRKFVNEKKQIISLHEPHPKNVLKSYQLAIIIDYLKL